METEYLERHNRIWPELVTLLHEYGISDYSIFLDNETQDLIGVMTLASKELADALPDQPVMKKWWAYMRDIMETNADNSPVTIPMTQVFYLP